MMKILLTMTILGALATVPGATLADCSPERLVELRNRQETIHRAPEGTLPAPALSPMLQEIKAAVDSTRRVRAELLTVLEQDGAGAAEIRAECEAMDLALQITILEIQARHLRAQGRQELARRIENDLTGLTGTLVSR